MQKKDVNTHMSITKTPASMIDPSGATNGQVLTYNGSTSVWVASAAPSPDPNSFYTTVGNASAGIFVSAVCFIPSNPGTGTWTAPAGCYTARVTVVGGGGSSSSAGGRSHFNYPSGSTTSANQMFANGGQSTIGGSAGWNGINNLATAGTFAGGGSGGGGYGGAGGSSGFSGGSLGAGGSYGRGGRSGTVGGGGGSGGVGGSGGSAGSGGGGHGGGSPTLSYAAANLTNFSTAISQNPGNGSDGGGGAGWASCIVSVTPGQSYTYEVGAGAFLAGYGMVVIEW